MESWFRQNSIVGLLIGYQGHSYLHQTYTRSTKWCQGCSIKLL